jgi:large subunit ribosomal protein L3e
MYTYPTKSDTHACICVYQVGCIGSWHPASVGWSVPRAGQKGYHHRIEVNKKVHCTVLARLSRRLTAPLSTRMLTTQLDLTEKGITPMGGFPHYGTVLEDFVLIKGCCIGTKKRVITLRMSLLK